MNTCEELIEYLAAYADDELDGELRERVRGHLEECPSCRRECEELKRVAALYREAPVPEPTDAQWAKVSAAVVHGTVERPVPARAERPSAHGWRWWLSGALAAAAVVLLVFLLPRQQAPVVGPPDNGTRTAVLELESMDPDYTVNVILPRDAEDVLVISLVRVEEDPPDG